MSFVMVVVGAVDVVVVFIVVVVVMVFVVVVEAGVVMVVTGIVAVVIESDVSVSPLLPITIIIPIITININGIPINPINPTIKHSDK